MMFDRLRRRIALKVAPELAKLPHNVVHAQSRAQSPAAAEHARQLRVLDRLYAASTGEMLLERNAPAYSGPMYEWRTPRQRIAPSVIMTLKRLRINAACGVHMTTHFVALNYFAAIWPEDMEWPAGVDKPRPQKTKREAA